MSVLFNIISVAHAANNVAAFGAVLDPIITNVVNPLIGLAFAVATVVFVYGVIQMIIHGADSDARSKGKMSMLGGIIGMFIMLSAWGIIQLVSNTIQGFN